MAGHLLLAGVALVSYRFSDWTSRANHHEIDHGVNGELITDRNPGSCDYCGGPLDARVYFCPSCAKPHRPVEQMLTPSAVPYQDIETNLRNKAPDVWTVYFGFLSVIIVAVMTGHLIWGGAEQQAITLLVSLALLAATAVAAVRYWNELRPMWMRSGALHPASYVGLGLLIPMLALNQGYHHWLTTLFGNRISPSEIFSAPYEKLVFLCVLPALVEEIAFRGIIQHRLESAVKPWWAIGTTAVLFSAAHFSFFSAPYLALLGVLLGWMKWRTGSLYPSMLLHFLHNLIVISYFGP